MLSKRARKQSVGFCNSIPVPGKAIRVVPMELEKNLILICWEMEKSGNRLTVNGVKLLIEIFLIQPSWLAVEFIALGFRMEGNFKRWNHIFGESRQNCFCVFKSIHTRDKKVALRLQLKYIWLRGKYIWDGKYRYIWLEDKCRQSKFNMCPAGRTD